MSLAADSAKRVSKAADVDVRCTYDSSLDAYWFCTEAPDDYCLNVAIHVTALSDARLDELAASIVRWRQSCAPVQ